MQYAPQVVSNSRLTFKCNDFNTKTFELNRIEGPSEMVFTFSNQKHTTPFRDCTFELVSDLLVEFMDSISERRTYYFRLQISYFKCITNLNFPFHIDPFSIEQYQIKRNFLLITKYIIPTYFKWTKDALGDKEKITHL